MMSPHLSNVLPLPPGTRAYCECEGELLEAPYIVGLAVLKDDYAVWTLPLDVMSCEGTPFEGPTGVFLEDERTGMVTEMGRDTAYDSLAIAREAVAREYKRSASR